MSAFLSDPPPSSSCPTHSGRPFFLYSIISCSVECWSVFFRGTNEGFALKFPAMASSQVELGSSSSPFGCVLRDHNHREQQYGGGSTARAAAHAAFEKNLKELVRDRLHSRIAISSDDDSAAPQETETPPSPPSSLSSVSPREARILDRWAARQAREMVTTVDRQSHEAELSALWNSHAVSTRTSILFVKATAEALRTQPQSDGCSVEIPNLGAASLVQRWRNFEAEADQCSGGGAAATPDSAKLQLRRESPEEEAASSSDDWASDRGATVAMSTGRPSGELDVDESERIRVADIIRRLTTTSTPQSSLPSFSADESSRHVNDCSMIGAASVAGELAPSRKTPENSPRIRGRQAFNDLLVQMELERRRELGAMADRRPVSRFPHRGRIQSFLRLRFLHRQPAFHHEHRSSVHGTPSWDRQRQTSAITLLRERFNGGAVHEESLLSNKVANSEFPCATDQPRAAAAGQQSFLQIRNSETYGIEEFDEDSGPSSEASHQNARSEPNGVVHWEEDGIAGDDNNVRPTSNWVTEISRPESDWEDRRQERYREILYSSDAGDLRQLLQRRRVSTFLASDRRETMDQMVVSFLESRAGREGEAETWGRGGYIVAEQDEMAGDDEEEDEEEEEAEQNLDYEEEESPVSGYYDQTSPSTQISIPFLSGRYHETDSGSDRVPLPFLAGQFCSHANRQYSCKHHSSIEMNVICDLRRHIEQLHDELSDLQKSMKSCREVQAQLQQSMERRISSFENETVGEGEGEGSNQKPATKGSCCICYEKRVDSLLYRCGHMCTCVECAQELRRSSQRCPICRAPIMDVVRAYVES